MTEKRITPIRPTGQGTVYAVTYREREFSPTTARLFPTREQADIFGADLGDHWHPDFITEVSFLSDTMVTDTRVFEVVAATDKTIQLRHTVTGEVLQRQHRDGNPYPLVWAEAIVQPSAKIITVRRRRDGTYRVNGGSPLRPATIVDGRPVTYTDYRM